MQADDGHKLTHNYRHIQPLNSRALVFVEGYVENGSPIKHISASMLLLSVVLVAVAKAFPSYS